MKTEEKIRNLFLIVIVVINQKFLQTILLMGVGVDIVRPLLKIYARTKLVNAVTIIRLLLTKNQNIGV